MEKRKHTKLAATMGVSALAVALSAGVAFADTGGWGGIADGHADIDQHSEVGVDGAAKANTGENWVESLVGGDNWTEQGCQANTDGGDTEGGNDTTTGNTGGTCTNDGTSSNSLTGLLSLISGSASASNAATVAVNQTNSGGVDVTADIEDFDVYGYDGGISGARAHLGVTQHSGVSVYGGAWANSGGNKVSSAVVGTNSTWQHGSANTSGGNVGSGGEYGSNDASTGNTGGSASNTSSSTNTANGTVNVTTGAATANNTSSVTVSQNNSGGVSVNSTATDVSING